MMNVRTSIARLSATVWCLAAALAPNFAPNLTPAFAAGTPYPVKPIRIIIPFSVGGGTDQLIRTLQPALVNALGQQVVLDNRGGASGIIGAEIAAHAAPDGYTLLAITTTHTVNPAFTKKMPYDLVKDFAAVSLVATQPNILIVHPTLPAKTMKELVAMGKSGKLTYASGGNGSAPHLSGELLQLVAGIPLIHVPFKGAGPGVLAVLGNQVSMMFVGPLSADPYVKSGRLRALAVADAKRSTVMPDVPTVAEAGYPGTEAGTWYGILAPAGTPRPVIDAFHAGMLKSLAVQDTAKRLLTQGAEVIGSGPAEFERMMRAEIVKWANLVQRAGLTAQ